MGQAASHALVAAADLQPPLAMGVSGLETELGESPQHIKILGSTRFMKTILCKQPHEGQLVLHVFMRPVSMSFDVTQQIATLRGLYSLLGSAQHVLSHVRVISDERAVYILRQYLHNNLYDRISTRPFLSSAEKRWIAYQMLVALREAHSRGVCHGDIKAENIVVTSWNLAYLADFAPFKPTYLPADDPAEFNFYFDSAGRQCCCIAPERFYDPGSNVAQLLAAPKGGGGSANGLLALQPSMDIFSVGCVIAELFLDGNPLFSLSRLLQYRSKQADTPGAAEADSLVAGIADKEIAELVQNMIQLDPEARLSASEYLDRWAGIFPRAPLAAYMDTASPDARMRALHAEVSSESQVSDSMCEITASVACANVRNCIQPSSRCMGIKVLLQCSGSGGAMMRGDPDLILPYLVALAADPSPRVRAEAIVAIRDLLLDLRQLTPINGSIFDDYIAPHLQYFAADASVGVRCMVASVMADIADSAYYLKQLGNSEPPMSDFLGGQMRAIVSRLSFDETEVKHVLLCSFPQLYERGIQSLSHIITYLNDRDCWFLRAAFFDVVFAASGQISRHASREYIVPLINLGDQEVFVVISALRALVRLVPQMSPAMLWDKLVEVQTVCKEPGLRMAAKGFTDLTIANARLPMAAELARLALDIAKANSPDPPMTFASVQPSDTDDRLVELRGIGAALRTVFLTAVRDPWAAGAESVKDNGSEMLNSFLRKKALELESSQPTAPSQPLDGWRPHGTLVGEVSEHTEAVTCLVAALGGVFVSGSDDGTVRVFDGAVFRKSAVSRSVAVHAQGGRITGLAFSAALDCVASASDAGSIHVLRVSRTGLNVLATASLPRGEHATCVGFSGAVVVVATSLSRVVFLDAIHLAQQDAVQLPAAHGRPTSIATSPTWAFAVIGTSAGACVLVDARFRVTVRAYQHLLGHAVTGLTAHTDDSVLVATAAGDVCVLNLRTGRWPTCVCARSLHELKGNSVSRRQRVNGLARVPHTSTVLTGSNDALLRLWDLGHLERSYVVNSADASPPPYASYRLNDTVYYCENAAPLHAPPSPGPRIRGAMADTTRATAAAANSSRAAGPISTVAVLTVPAAMILCGQQSGSIRVLI
ncbi:Serine/threonine-protein kinase [Coemansia sp. RSA 2050]|nr:Serine/threonine-protein kinase [Coemansia sp. RSA 2050]